MIGIIRFRRREVVFKQALYKFQFSGVLLLEPTSPGKHSTLIVLTLFRASQVYGCRTFVGEPIE